MTDEKPINGLDAKLLAAARSVKRVEKRGENKAQSYSYVMAEDIAKAGHEALEGQGLLVDFEILNAVEHPIKSRQGADGLVVTIEGRLNIADPETGDSTMRLGMGSGSDYPGDKAIYKAATGARKYALIHLLGIPIGDDPEEDRAAPSNGGGGETIPKANAKALVDRVWKAPDAKAQLQLAISHQLGEDVGDVSTKAKATAAVARLTFVKAGKLDEWITKRGLGEVSGLGKLVVMPSGVACFFDDAPGDDGEPKHAYYRARPAKLNEKRDRDNHVEDDHGTPWCRGKRLTAVTTAIKPLDFRPDGLMKWAARLNGTGIARLAGESLTGIETGMDPEEALAWLSSADSIWEALEEAALTYEDIRNEAAIVGRNVHELALRALAEGKAAPDYGELTPEEVGHVQGCVQFWLDHSPVKALQVEQIVVDPDLGVAGRPDLRAKFGECEDATCPCHDGIIGLIDAKTGSRFIPTSAHVQLPMYDLLSEASGFGGSDWLAILKLDESGEYELLRAAGTRDDAKAALDAYRRAGRIENEARRGRNG